MAFHQLLELNQVKLVTQLDSDTSGQDLDHQ